MITNQLLYQLSYTGFWGSRVGTANENTSKRLVGYANWTGGSGVFNIENKC